MEISRPKQKAVENVNFRVHRLATVATEGQRWVTWLRKIRQLELEFIVA